MLGSTLRVATLAALSTIASGQACTHRVFGDSSTTPAYEVAHTTAVTSKLCKDILVGYSTGASDTTAASSTCNTGSFGAVTGCTAVQCTSTSTNHDSKWTAATNVGAVATIGCEVYDSVKYKSGQSVVNACIWDYTAGAAVWSTTPNVEACVANTCADLVDGSITWTAVTNSGDTSSVACDTYDSAAYASGGSATRLCTAGSFGPVDVSACTPNANYCEADTLFPVSAASASVTANCVDFDPVKYTSGTISRTCSATGGQWSATDFSSCVKAKCAADGIWPETEVGERAYNFCASVATALRTTGVAYRDCAIEEGTANQKLTRVATWGTVNLGGCSAYVDCAGGDFTHSGITYNWPKTASGVTASVSCEKYDATKITIADTDVVTRACSNGVWGTPDATACDTWIACPAEKGFTAAMDAGASATTITCAAYGTGIGTTVHATDTSANVSRTCPNGVPTYDVSACNLKCASGLDTLASSGTWGVTAAGETAQMACNTYHATYTAAGFATRACGDDGTWAATATATACVKNKCLATAADAYGFAETDGGVAATAIKCSAYSLATTDFVDDAGQTATRNCNDDGTWAAATLTSCKCKADGIWPETTVGETAEVLCAKHNVFYGLSAGAVATRACGVAGWALESAIDESACVTMATTASLLCTDTAPFGKILVGDTGAVVCSETTTISATGGNYDGPTSVSANGWCVTQGTAADVNTAAVCSARVCPSDGVWPETTFGATARLGCGTLNSNIYGMGVATRACSGGSAASPSWAAATLTDCELAAHMLPCPVSGALTLTNADAAGGAVDCDTYNSIYKTGTNVKFGCPAKNTREFWVDDLACKGAFASGKWAKYDGCLADTVSSVDVVAASNAGDVVTTAKCATHDATLYGDTGTWTCDARGSAVWTKDISTCGCAAGTWQGLTMVATADAGTYEVTSGCATWTGRQTSDSGAQATATGDLTATCDGGVWSYTSGCTFSCPTETLNGIAWAAKTGAGAGVGAVDAAADIKCNLYIATGASATVYDNSASVARACDANGKWGAMDLSSCVYIQCAVDGVWAATNDNTVATVPCSLVSEDNWMSGVASRLCTNAVWGTIDDSHCIPKAGISICEAEGGLPRTLSNAAAITTGLCASWSSEYASGTMASATCTDFGWSVDTTGCVLKQCAAESTHWTTATDVGATHAGVDCNTINSAYATGTLATRSCYLSTTGVATWYDVDYSSCTYPNCAADGVWVETDSEMWSTIKCSALSTDYVDDAAQTVTRKCENGVWESAYSLALCTLAASKTGCATDGAWLGGASTTAAFTRTLNCAEYDAEIYTSGTATRTCTAGVWSAVDLSGCVKTTCPALADAFYSWPATTKVLESASVLCHTYNPTKYEDDYNVVTNLCNAGTPNVYAGADVSACTARGCYAKEDSYADQGTTTALVWDTPSGTPATMGCEAFGPYTAGNSVTRACTDGVLSPIVDISACTDSDCSSEAHAGITWPDTKTETVVRMACPSGGTEIYKAGEGYASRQCASSAWVAADMNDCVKLTCPAVTGIWTEQAYGTTSSAVNCIVVDPNLYSAGTATRTCGTTATGGALDITFDLTGCTKRTCTDTVWGTVDAGATGVTVDCSLAAPSLYKSGANASRACTKSTSTAGEDPTWGAIDYSNCGCAASGGFAETADSGSATQTCASYDATLFASGNVSNACTTNTFGGANVESCTTLGSVTECAAAGEMPLRGYGGRVSKVLCTDLASSGSNYKGGWAYAMCTGTTWSTPDTTGCVAKDCAAAGGYSAAIHGEKGFDACSDVSSNYASGNCYKTCTHGVFGPADCSECVMKRGVSTCPASADGVWPLTFGGTIVGVQCSTISKAYEADAAEKAYRRCDHSLTEDFVGVWSTVDYSACVLHTCAVANGFPETAIGLTVNVDCSAYESNYKTGATTKAYRTCSVDFSSNDAAWEPADVGVTGDADKCLWDDCAAAGGYTTAIHGADGTLACATADATNFSGLATTVLAKKTCGDNKTFGTANVDDCLTGLGALGTPVKFCHSDDVFPLTLASASATGINCVDYDTDMYASGTLTRACDSTGAWEAPVLTSCVNKTCPQDNTASADNPSGYNFAAATTLTGASATVACATYDATKYTDASNNVTRYCMNNNGVPTWDPVDVAACTGFAACAALAPFDSTASGASSTTETCADAGAAASGASVTGLYSAGTVTKACVEAVWAETDYSACTYAKCADDGVWTVSAGKAVGSEADEEVSIDCSTYNAKYDTGTATKAKRVCLSATPTSKAVWSSVVDKSACVPTTAETANACAADAPWQKEISGVTQSIICNTYNPAYTETVTTYATRACSTGAWANPDVSGCVLKTCAADTTTTTGFTWAATEVNAYATLACATVNAALYASGTIYRHCDLDTSNLATWGSVDESSCVKVNCASDDFWGAAVASGTTVTKTCKEFDIRYELDGGVTTRTCTDGVWGDADMSGCTPVSGESVCAATAVFPETFVDSWAFATCVAYNPRKYSAGNVKVLCAGSTPAWEDVDTSGCTKKSCAHSFPWESVPVDTYAEAYCPDANPPTKTWYSGGRCMNLCVDDGTSADPVFDDWANRIDITLTGPNAPVLASGVTTCAAHTKGFPESIATQTARVLCTTLDAEIYSAGYATLLCDSVGTPAVGTWAADTAIVTTGCTLKQCAASGAFPATDVLATATVNCVDHDSVKYQSGSATATCTNASGTPTWGTADESACVWNDCAADGIWAQTADAGSATALCSDYDATHFAADGETVSRACNEMVWATYINEKTCTIASGIDKCTDSDWGDAYVGQVKYVDCATVNTAMYKTGTDGIRTCETGPTYGTPDESACIYLDCVVDANWPATADGATASITCDQHDSTFYSNTQSATRLCTETVWGTIDITACELAAGIFQCAAGDGYNAALTTQVSTKPCVDLDGDYLSMYASGTAEATCTNNSDDSAAAFGAPDVTNCVAKQCLNSESNAYGFPDTDVTQTATLPCEEYNTNMIALSGTDGLAKLDCTLGDDGVAAWSDEVDVTECEDTTASSARLCSLGAGMLSAACVAAVL